jgi:hypothetical protein
MTPPDELFEIASRLEAASTSKELATAENDLLEIERVAKEAKRAFSGSWMGYHAYVYTKDLQPPPTGVRFSQEWGLMRTIGSSNRSKEHWKEYDPEKLTNRLRKKAGDPDLSGVEDASASATETFNEAKAEISSILLTENSDTSDAFLSKLLDDLNDLNTYTASELAQAWQPRGQVITRDTAVISKGNKVPPHVILLADSASIRQPFLVCSEASKICKKAASHLERKAKRMDRDARVGTNVFIGHGRSQAWRELKDFVQDRLHLPWDEFNRVPVAGITNQARLSEMLDAASVALVVMTAEDETSEGKMQARMNVIHEVGLFQGRLGFTKAIVVLEDSCEEFSNIQGLGQIRFAAGNIASCFEEVRRVLEREGLINP